ncbi:AP-1 complex subunit sigma-2-like isoform X2 [Littorina saxatilis]|uniref:AP-1 complex subunit sigma-2-like isoform X2 n=1 Tax=Littorina saxatilis TaxID=31220 RepID=UPI0038B599D5
MYFFVFSFVVNEKREGVEKNAIPDGSDDILSSALSPLDTSVDDEAHTGNAYEVASVICHDKLRRSYNYLSFAAPPKTNKMMQFMLLFSRQGKLRLQKWYMAYPDKTKKKIVRELVTMVLSRKPKMCSFLEWKEVKVVYKRYASLYFCCAVEPDDNELLTLEIIHRYVELLDKYFGSVCELDIIFNFEKAYFMLDEFMLGGEVQETSKKNVLKAIAAQDLLQEEETPQGFFEDHGLG